MKADVSTTLSGDFQNITFLFDLAWKPKGRKLASFALCYCWKSWLVILILLSGVSSVIISSLESN